MKRQRFDRLGVTTEPLARPPGKSSLSGAPSSSASRPPAPTSASDLGRGGKASGSQQKRGRPDSSSQPVKDSMDSEHSDSEHHGAGEDADHGEEDAQSGDDPEHLESQEYEFTRILTGEKYRVKYRRAPRAKDGSLLPVGGRVPSASHAATDPDFDKTECIGLCLVMHFLYEKKIFNGKDYRGPYLRERCVLALPNQDGVGSPRRLPLQVA